MDTIIIAIIGAIATITAAIIGAVTARSKDRINANLKREWSDYKNAVSQRESYLDVDYGIKIVWPKDDEQVGEGIEVTGIYAIMPPPKTLRLFTINPEKTNYGERYWPQEIVTDFFPETKTWRAKVNIGGGPSDIKWGIFAAIMGPSAIVLWDFYYKVGPKIGWWDFEGWPPDAKVCHRIRVKRV
jgi:hypothetical protein